MTSAYTPQPGTVTARSVAAVHALPAGQIIANVELAEQLGQHPSVVNCGMEAPVRYGLIEKHMNGRLVSWSRGNGIPLAERVEEEPDDAPIVQRVVPAVQEPIPEAPPVTAPQPRAKQARAITAEASTTPQPIRIALWSDGQLHIRRAGADLIVLSKDETRELVRYLGRMADATEAAA
jgi:hypothetical protein